jgi:hypothetical protein
MEATEQKSPFQTLSESEFGKTDPVAANCCFTLPLALAGEVMRSLL